MLAAAHHVFQRNENETAVTMRDLIRLGDFTFSNQGFVFEVDSEDTRTREDVVGTATDSSFHYEDIPRSIGKYDIIPFGDNNNLPTIVRDTVSKHNLAPRVFTKRGMLTWGDGPILYRVKVDPENPQRVYKEYVQDDEVQAWLDSWDAESYLLHAMTDFNYMEGHFTKVFRSRGVRIGKRPLIAKLEHVHISDARFAGVNLRKNNPTHVAVSKWGVNQFSTDVDIYPLSNRLSLVDHAVSIMFSKMVGFGQKYYSSPDVLGTLPWLRRASDVPAVLEALTNNSLHIKWHIQAPARYWDKKEEAIRERCNIANIAYKPEMLEELKESVYMQLTKILGGKSNVGKFWASETIIEVLGNQIVTQEWKITAIDQKIKDFVEAQIKISERADVTTVGGLGLHQALSNISTNGKSDSGSEQLYAYKNFILSEVQMPEMTICSAINAAIAHNWPEKKLKLGFYRTLPEKEEDITSSKRISNAV